MRTRSYIFAIEGLEDLGSIDELKPQIAKAAQMAINRAADRGRTASVREMRRQVNFPISYLQGPDSRLNVTQRATASRLEGVISGRRRATSLARFVVGQGAGGKGVRVGVKPGSSVLMRRAFLMKLKRGSAGVDTKGNMGLAVRVPAGQRPSAAYRPVDIGNGLFLLYGPSVDQVFQTVRQDVSKDIENFLEAEFNRLMDLKL